jgi:F-type H+-transporting ATPase subunit b
MPQLDPHTFSPQLIWLAITFIGLYFLMAKVALPRIGSALEARRDRIASDLGEAQSLKVKTEKAIALYEAGLAEARAKAHQNGMEARGALDAEVGGHRQKIESEIAEKIAAAEKRISSAKSAALADIESMASGLADDIVSQLTGSKAAQADVSAAVSRASAARG